jgi:predicted amidohydrolase YtcJ
MGIPVALGTDATRVSSYHPWQALYWLVSGRTAGDMEIYPMQNRLDRITALRLMTVGSARLTGEEEVKGKIEAGYYADMALLSDDYLTVEVSKIPAIESLLTLMDGRIVYGKGKYESLSPAQLPVMPAWSPAAYYIGYGGKNKR